MGLERRLRARNENPQVRSLATILNSYDQVPYPSFPYSKTHPDHIAAIATLLGLKPSTAPYRVLELGCASGGNLIPMALARPECDYVGIDASARQVEHGRQTIQLLQLENISLQYRSILDVYESLGLFDYIICHGVFSWVPTDVQEKILSICGSHLTKNGIAYVSYNTEPGWRQKGALRDMMRYHVDRVPNTSAGEKIASARDLLDFLVQATQSSSSAYGSMLREQHAMLKHHSDAYVFHEHLEEHNDPLWFLDFSKRLEAHRLQFLGEADFGSMVASMSWPSDVQKRLDGMTRNLLEQEQYMDFVRNRAFRQSLICHASRSPSYAIRGDRISKLYAASSGSVVPRSTDEPNRSNKEWLFELANGESLSTASRTTQLVFEHLGRVWPERVAVEKLLDDAIAGATLDVKDLQDAKKVLEVSLFNIYSSTSGRLIELSAAPLDMVSVKSARPIVNALARILAKQGAPVVNRRHEVVEIAPVDRRIMPLLDGTRQEVDVLEEMVRQNKKLDLELRTEDDNLITDPEAIRVILTSLIPERLRYYERSSLLD